MVNIKVAVALPSAAVRLPRGVLALTMDTANTARATVRMSVMTGSFWCVSPGHCQNCQKPVSGSFGSEGVTYL
jgi:hypothetical protein